MGLDDASNTCLVLGLGFPTNPETPHKTSKKPPATAAPATGFEPFLTLGLSDESYKVTVTKKVDVNKGGGCLQHRHHEEPPTSAAAAAAAAGDWCRPASPDPSAVSSFSSGRVRRERDFSSEEDEDGVNARKKLRLNKEQSALLEESFKQHSALNPNQKQALARKLNLKPRQVEVWFQNRRARTKLKQTEVDCELLKRFCETLTNENRRLQKELQELKALEMAYTNMPAATLTVCPSCERTGGGGNPKKPFSMTSKPRFYNHVTNPSAAY